METLNHNQKAEETQGGMVAGGSSVSKETGKKSGIAWKAMIAAAVIAAVVAVIFFCNS